MWFDNHLLTDSKAMPPTGFKGRYGKAPSAARLVYEHYLPSHPALARHQTLVTETDRLDSAQLTLEDVVSPSGYVLLGLTLDPRTGLGGLREYFDELLPAVRARSIDEVLALASVRERAARMREQDQAFRDAARARSRLDGDVVVTDFRDLDPIPVGNRFLIFTLFPEASAAVRVQWGPERERIAVSAGRSILNRSSRANIGVLMSLHGGGGHAGAGACLLDPAQADARITRDRGRAQAEWMSASSGRTCPGSTTGRTSVRARGGPREVSRSPSAASGCGASSEGSRTPAPGWCGSGSSATAAPASGRTRAASHWVSTSASSPISTRPSRRLREAGLRGLLVLTDFLWFAPARVENGVQLGGRRELVRDPEKRARLLERVFAPIAERCARAPEIAAFDLMNEPEWATLGTGTLDPRRAISRREMRAFLSELAVSFHERAPQPVCVGLASARWRSLAFGLPLDFEQVHWYESLDSLTALARPVAPPGPGLRAPLLGEFPTRGASLRARADLRDRRAGRVLGRARLVGARHRHRHGRRRLPRRAATSDGPRQGSAAAGVTRCRSTASTSA